MKSLNTILALMIIPLLLITPINMRSESFQEKGQEGIREDVTVTLKLIQVYVTDKKGYPVTDLSIDDFELKDNGKRKTITEFERHLLPLPSVERKVLEVEPAQPVEKIMPRKFFLFFDFAFNRLDGVNMAKEAALHFINTQVVPTDEVGILSYSTTKGLLLHEYLTSDHAKIREAVNDLGLKQTEGRAGQLLEDQENSLRFSELQWEVGGKGRMQRAFRRHGKR